MSSATRQHIVGVGGGGLGLAEGPENQPRKEKVLFGESDLRDILENKYI